MKYGVTDQGFRKKGYEEILESMQERAKQLFGNDVNLSSASPLGLFMRLFAWSLSLIWSVAEKVYNSAYIGSASKQSLDYVVQNLNIKRFGPQPATGNITIYGTPGTNIPVGFAVRTDDDSAIVFKTKYDSTIGSDGSVSIPIEAESAGSKANVPANTITQVVNPASGIDSVNNPEKTDFGRDRESDYELRQRYYSQLGQNSTDIIQAITSAILDLGVKQVKVFENDSMVTDELGVPAKSIFAVVWGGDNQEIAEAIFTAKPGGIQAYGDTYVPIEDIGGNIHQIGFSRPNVVDTYYTIDIQTNNEYPVDGDSSIKQGIVDYIEELIIDDDVTHSKIINTIYNSCGGIDDFELYIGTSANPTTKDNIVISGLEVASTDLDKIVINHV